MSSSAPSQLSGTRRKRKSRFSDAKRDKTEGKPAKLVDEQARLVQQLAEQYSKEDEEMSKQLTSHRAFSESASCAVPVTSTQDDKAEQLRIQKEIQLLESRIRDANQRLVGHVGDKEAARKQADDSLSALHEERLQEYQNLATIEERMTKRRKGGNIGALDDDLGYDFDGEIGSGGLIIGRKDTENDLDMLGGKIRGGTWEHRKRAAEMLKTAEQAREFTLAAAAGAGKESNVGVGGGRGRHIWNYLPPDVLKTFLEQSKTKTGVDMPGADAVKLPPPTNTDADSNSNTANNSKLGSDNVGYQLLERGGWTDGSGLGANGRGIQLPITAAPTTTNARNTKNTKTTNTNSAPLSSNSGSIGGSSRGGSGVSRAGTVATAIPGAQATPTAIPDRAAGGGVGSTATHVVEGGDDAFEQYRKRMMLAYRFRPNPLNNPRRAYY